MKYEKEPRLGIQKPGSAPCLLCDPEKFLRHPSHQMRKFWNLWPLRCLRL